jgi:hypothetical protein
MNLGEGIPQGTKEKGVDALLADKRYSAMAGPVAKHVKKVLMTAIKANTAGIKKIKKSEVVERITAAVAGIQSDDFINTVREGAYYGIVSFITIEVVTTHPRYFFHLTELGFPPNTVSFPISVSGAF